MTNVYYSRVTTIYSKRLIVMASHMDLRKVHFRVVRFMMESGVKLGMKSVPLATAAQIYHRFFQETELQDYDPHLIGMTALYLAGKVEEEHLKLRDVINVCHRTLHRSREPLDIGEEYWAMRDSVVQTELLIMRMLQFQVNFNHPHKYLLHYLKSLYDWLDPETIKTTPIAKTAWGILRDSYHSDLALRYQAEHIAVAVLYLALQTYGVEVSYSNKAEKKWWEALSEDVTLEWMRTIINQIIDIYDLETTVR